MKRLMTIVAALFGAVLLGACGGAEVAVIAQLEGETTDTADAQPVAVPNMPVYLLPYDRDAVFDSLATAYGEPEPQIPDTLVALQDTIARARQAALQAEQQWQIVRDSLQDLSEQLQGLDRQSAEYITLFRDFGDLEQREQQLSRRMQTAYDRFNTLLTRFSESAEEIRLRRMDWADAAFADVDAVIEARLEELGREEYVDTTSAAGVAMFEGVPAGQWWIHARRELPDTELYWNVPVEIEDGENRVVLSSENAEERTKL